MALLVPSFRRWTATACALLLAAGTLAACGSSSSDNSSSSSSAGASGTPSGSASTSLDEQAVEGGDENLSFSKKTLTAKAGNVTIKMSNPSGNSLPHAIEIEGNGVEKETEVLQPGSDGSVTANLKPGKYTFYCPVGDHRSEGMQGTLTVS